MGRQLGASGGAFLGKPNCAAPPNGNVPMQSSLYVALSGQVALQKRLDTIANNIANMNTGGFRAEEVSFSTLLSKAGKSPTAFATAGETYISRRTGDLVSTGNPLDVAVRGDAFFALQTPEGIVYTRDGRLRMDESGALLNVNNHPILDAGGSGIRLDPTAGPPTIAQDGMISQNGVEVGAIGLFAIDPAARLTRHGDSAVTPDIPAQPVLDFSSEGVVQGMSEGSNVNPVLEMTRMITVSRAFEGAANAIQSSENSLQDAIKALGATS
jgi:flagellar basal-body rod protein FlgF